jgi:hypothetical protein
MMTAYNTMDAKIVGLKYGTDSTVKSMRVADDNNIPYGIPVFGYVGNDNDAFRYHNNSGIITFDADFEASNSIVITVDGTAVTAVVYATSHDATMLALIAQIEADITGASASSNTGGNNRVLTITIEDANERVVSEAITGGGSQPTGTVTVASTMVFKGFSLFVQREAAVRYDLNGNVIEAATAEYEENDPINVMVEGEIIVVTGAGVDAHNQAYVIATAGATEGQVDDSATNNVILTGVTIEETVAAAGLALVRINK